MRTTRPFHDLNNLADHEQLQTSLLRWIGAHADAGTAHILRVSIRRATESDLVGLRESMRGADPKNRAAWVIVALRNARLEREQRRASS